jgi:hypothetical protein
MCRFLEMLAGPAHYEKSLALSSKVVQLLPSRLHPRPQPRCILVGSQSKRKKKEQKLLLEKEVLQRR